MGHPCRPPTARSGTLWGTRDAPGAVRQRARRCPPEGTLDGCSSVARGKLGAGILGISPRTSPGSQVLRFPVRQVSRGRCKEGSSRHAHDGRERRPLLATRGGELSYGHSRFAKDVRMENEVIVELLGKAEVVRFMALGRRIAGCSPWISFGIQTAVDGFGRGCGQFVGRGHCPAR